MSKNDDLQIAEILGWRKNESAPVPMLRAPLWYHEKYPLRSMFIIPEFTTDPAADYLVLEWVRENMDTMQQSIYHEAIEEVMFSEDREGTSRIFGYLPGDYSHALLAIKEKE